LYWLIELGPRLRLGLVHGSRWSVKSRAMSSQDVKGAADPEDMFRRFSSSIYLYRSPLFSFQMFDVVVYP
jgi:hypothetical protein